MLQQLQAPKPLNRSVYVKLPADLAARLSLWCSRRGHNVSDWCLYAIDDRLDFETSVGTYAQGEI